MRTLQSFLVFALAMLTSFCLTACGGDDDSITPVPTPTPTPTSKIDIPTTENTKPVFSTEGGSATIKFTASQAWTATTTNDRASEWLSFSPASGISGNSTLTIITKENDTYDERSASITIKSGTASQTIVVTQKQKDALLVTSDKFEVDAEGGEISVEVKANIEFSVKTDVDWISQTNTRALNTSNLIFTIAENEETAKREGHITISSDDYSETVTVYQAGNAPTIVISKNEYSISSEGGDISVEIRSNVDVTVTLPKGGWISESTTRSMSTHTYVFVVSKNDGYDSRSAEILFTNKANNLSEKVTITQMQLDAIIVAKNQYEIDAKGGLINFEVQTNVDFDTYIDADWITMINTRALHSEKLSFAISANEMYEKRNATITIEGTGIKQSISIIQYGLGAVTGIELDKTSIEISVGSYIQIRATVLPENATNKIVEWSSSDESIATIDENGIVYAVSVGNAEITAVTENKAISAKCVVKVIEIENIKFSDEKVKEICINYYDSNGDGEISYDEAAQVTSLYGFTNNKYIKTFNELQFFTGLETINDNAFKKCTNLSSVVLPDNIKHIGNNAFSSTKLSKIHLPDNLVSIGNSAFQDTDFTTISFPKSLRSIGNYAFDGVKLNDISFSNSIETIGNYAFLSNKLKNLIIPEGVISIGDYAFANNWIIESLSLPSTLQSIGEGAFGFTEGGIGDNRIQKITLPEGITYIGPLAFSGSRIKTINIPKSLSSIDGVFRMCKFLSDIEIPENITSINYAFASCDRLAHIKIPESVTSMESAFYECKNLVSVNIPRKVNSITHTFQLCSNLAAIDIPDGVTEIEYAFDGCTSLKSIKLPSKIKKIGEAAFSNCKSLTSITIPESVAEIGHFAFQDCQSLVEINLPNSIESIGQQVFERCTKLKNISIPKRIQIIASGTFYNCQALTSIDIPEEVRLIEDAAFQGCIGINKIIIPRNVSFIGSDAFKNCTGLATITSLPTSPSTIGDSVFDNTNNAPIYVSKSSINKYKEDWDEYKNRIQAIPE